MRPIFTERARTGDMRRGAGIALFLSFAGLAFLTLALSLNSGVARAGASLRATSPGDLAWREIPAVTSNVLRDVHVVSSVDGWAVGENGTVLRYNGAQWSAWPTFTQEILVDVHMLSATEGYMMGWGVSGGGGNIYRWDGTAWTFAHATPADPNRMDDIGSNSLWVAGLFHIYHYDGTAWSTVFTDTRNIFSLQMYDTGQGPGGWAVGANGFMAEYDAGTWTVLSPSPAPQTLYHNSFTSPTDGWAVGFTATTYLLNWDGTDWSWDYTLTDIYIDRLAMVSPTLGWASSGVNDSSGKIYRFNGSAWTEDFHASQGLRNIYMLSATEGWAVGEAGVMVHYSDVTTPTPMPTSTATRTATSAVPSATSTSTGSTPTVTTVPPTATPCTLSFTDVPQDHTFYDFIRCLACRGVISGYADNSFRPGNNITRGQISKLVSNAAGFTEPVTGQTFEDVPTSNTFYEWIERLASHGVMSGYPCGGAGEPCGPGSRPYFRWQLDATRGQLSKIVSEAAEFNEPIPSDQQTFSDVPTDNPFWVQIERLAGRGVITGYPCGGTGEPCDEEGRPYFRWGFNVTRGQASKIVAESFYPGCVTPAR